MSKSKFQISRLLENRITAIANGLPEESPTENITKAYILGFHSGNITNYVGLTSDSASLHNPMPVIGLVFFKSEPEEDEIRSEVKKLFELSERENNFGNDDTDKNRNLYLVYCRSKETNNLVSRLFDTCGSWIPEQPKFVIIDESKIYTHSPLVKLTSRLILDIGDQETLIGAFNPDAKGLTLSLEGSNFSVKLPCHDKNSTETLYDYLDPPAEVLQAGDYLPQMTKADKEKLIEKWRNKMKSQRAPLELNLEHEGLSFSDGSIGPTGDKYPLEIEIYHRVQANNSIRKTTISLLTLIRRRLILIKKILSQRQGELEKSELKLSTYEPATLGHLVHAIYPIPSSKTPDYGYLRSLRKELHETFLLPLCIPQFRYSQRLLNLQLQSSDELDNGYLCNVHVSILDQSKIKNGLRSVINGKYTYHHYLQDKVQDNGWGCAYRSLQTIISWFKHQGYLYSPDVEPRGRKNEDKTEELRRKLNSESRVPTHEEIQTVLVHIGDKQESFIGSQKWIGSQEVCYVLNHLYDLDSKFISVSSGSELTYKARELAQHFDQQSTPVMIGGGVLAHTIIGIDFNEKNGDTNYLILDPHYTGSEDLSTITKKGWCGWKRNNFWEKSSFYNLCLPQRPDDF